MEFIQLDSSHIDSLLELYVQLDPANSCLTGSESREIWKQQIEGNRSIKYFGAVENGKVLSTCYAVIIPNLTNQGRPICFVENVVTDSMHRNQGLAGKVMEMAVGFAKENKCYKVILQSGAARKQAHQFYEKAGFCGTSKKAFDMRLE